MPSDISQLNKWKDNTYLEEKVGDQSTMVEKRSSANNTFGNKGNEFCMSVKKSREN